MWLAEQTTRDVRPGTEGARQVLDSLGSDNLIKYKGVSTPKRLLMSSKYLESRSHFKLEDSINEDLRNKGGVIS